MIGNQPFKIAPGYLDEKAGKLERIVNRIGERNGETTLLELGEIYELAVVIRDEAHKWYVEHADRFDEIEGAAV